MSSGPSSYRVVLFGWLQARSVHLAKYENVSLRERMCFCPSSTGPDLSRRFCFPRYLLPCPPFQVWTGPELRASRVDTFRSNLLVLLSPSLSGRNLDRLAEQVQADTSPVVFHLMSNGGALAFGEFCQKFSSERTAATLFGAQVRGLVFDSAPGILTPGIAASGVLAAHRGVSSSSSLGQFLDDPLRAVFRSYLGMTSTRARLERAWLGLEESFPDVRRSFLYSASDKIIPSESVERFIARQRAMGREVRARRWDDTPHVQLLRYHEKEYTAELRRAAGLSDGDLSAARGRAAQVDHAPLLR